MVALALAIAVSLVVSLVGTPLLIKFLHARQYGQFIRQDGPTAHYLKRGTPTMGGLMIMLATVLGWLCAHLFLRSAPTLSGSLLMLLFLGLGAIGFLDDFIKITKHRSLGLNAAAKIVLQLLVGVVFAVLALLLVDENGMHPASLAISVVRDISPAQFTGGMVGSLVVVTAIIWINFLITAWSNGVNLTDGLDGLATGSSLFAFAAYGVVGLWQFYQSCTSNLDGSVMQACYSVSSPLDLAIISFAIVGACFGFLWWNTSPAQIFMGDTGSLALGGAFAGLTILTHTEFLGLVIGGLFFIIVVSDVIQIGVFKMTHKRVFKMAPLHHHFELLGWPEVTIVVRFWIIAGLFAIIGIGIFYAEWVVQVV